MENKIARTKVGNFLGLVMLHFLLKCIFEITSGKFLFSIVSLIVSGLYFYLLSSERKASPESIQFFRMTTVPYYFFTLFFALDLFSFKLDFSSILWLLSSFCLSAYSLYIIIAPKKVIGLDVEIYKLFGKLFKQP